MKSDFASDIMGPNAGVTITSKMHIESSLEDGRTNSLESLDSGDLDRSMDSQEVEETKVEIHKEFGRESTREIAGDDKFLL